jgi:hypothetical protein
VSPVSNSAGSPVSHTFPVCRARKKAAVVENGGEGSFGVKERTSKPSGCVASEFTATQKAAVLATAATGSHLSKDCSTNIAGAEKIPAAEAAGQGSGGAGEQGVHRTGARNLTEGAGAVCEPGHTTIPAALSRRRSSAPC